MKFQPQFLGSFVKKTYREGFGYIRGGQKVTN